MNDNKIEEAFKKYNEKVENELAKRLTIKPTNAEHYAETAIRQCAFIAGAKWMQEELLKDLLHPIEEEPNKGKMILMEMSNGNNYALYWVNDNYSWKCICTMFTTTKWLYVGDLFPKEGGQK